MVSLLYNNVDSDAQEASSENASVTLNYVLARNLRLLAEGYRDIENDANRVTVGLVTAF